MNSISMVEKSAVEAVDVAVKCFISRQHRDVHPEGAFDSVARWEPSSKEKCDCCNSIRPPSRSYPFSLIVHCRTMTHIANLFKVDESKLRKAVNAYKKSLKVKQDSVGCIK